MITIGIIRSKFYYVKSKRLVNQSKKKILCSLEHFIKIPLVYLYINRHILKYSEVFFFFFFIAVLHVCSATFDLSWQSKKTNHYAIFPAGLPKLNEVTICFWMRTTDWESELVVLSYATSRNDNEIVIYLPEAEKIRFYVSGSYKYVLYYIFDRSVIT